MLDIDDFILNNFKKKINDNEYDDDLYKNKYRDDYLLDYYDLVLYIDSLENLQINGWKIVTHEKGYEKYTKNKDKKCTLVSVLGNKNTGKSFILSKISNLEIPDGFNISTKGLSIIYPEYEEKNIIFLDTPGLEDPLCEDDECFKFKTENEKYLKLNEEEKFHDSIKNYINENEYITQIKKFTRDKELTNEFIKRFVIHYSNINIYVVDSEIDLKEQNFYKYFLENKINIIIHNLKTFTKREEVEEYIDYFLLREVVFKLKKNLFTKINNIDEQKTNNYYYTQIIEENKNMQIIHLIMANDKSEAGSFYNESTINFIKNTIEKKLNFDKFPIIEKVKEFLFEHSKEFFNDPLENLDDIKIIDENDGIHFLKYLGKPFELKECYIDELENTKFIQSNYKPYYRVYKAKYKDENGEEIKLFIDLKISGIVNKLELPHLDVNNKETILTIRGIRNINIKNIEQEAFKTTFYFNDKNNEFNLKINIPNEKCIIKNLYKRIIYADKGLYRFIYDI